MTSVFWIVGLNHGCGGIMDDPAVAPGFDLRHREDKAYSKQQKSQVTDFSIYLFKLQQI
jgi:hypothetical protein